MHRPQDLTYEVQLWINRRCGLGLPKPPYEMDTRIMLTLFHLDRVAGGLVKSETEPDKQDSEHDDKLSMLRVCRGVTAATTGFAPAANPGTT